MKYEGPDVLAEGDLSPADTAALLDAAASAWASRPARHRVVHFTWEGVRYRAKGSPQRLSVLSAKGGRYIAYRWSC